MPASPAPDWPTLLALHGPLAWKAAYRLLANRSDADDALQDAFHHAFTLSRRQTIDNWPALLTSLATRRAIDRLRSRPRTASLDPLPNPAAPDAPDPELSDHLRRALAQLPPQQALAFCLRHLDDLSYADIARQLALSENAVGVLLHRARNRLRELLPPTLAPLASLAQKESPHA